MYILRSSGTLSRHVNNSSWQGKRFLSTLYSCSDEGSMNAFACKSIVQPFFEEGISQNFQIK